MKAEANLANSSPSLVVISQRMKSTSYIKNMMKVLKEIVILFHMHILQEYGRDNSTISVFLRIQGWGFAVYVLLLKQEEINLKG